MFDAVRIVKEVVSIFKPLFGTKIEPCCRYCQFGENTKDNTLILCPKNGVMNPESNCKKFIYCPLKRIPKRARPLQQFSQSDFDL